MKRKTTIYKSDVFVILAGSKIVYHDCYYVNGWIGKSGIVLKDILVKTIDTFDVQETSVVENYKADIEGMYKGYWNEQRSKKTR